jgi:hypothetical protein
VILLGEFVLDCDALHLTFDVLLRSKMDVHDREHFLAVIGIFLLGLIFIGKVLVKIAKFLMKVTKFLVKRLQALFRGRQSRPVQSTDGAQSLEVSCGGMHLKYVMVNSLLRLCNFIACQGGGILTYSYWILRQEIQVHEGIGTTIQMIPLEIVPEALGKAKGKVEKDRHA